jgi:hypothetical protein
MRPLIETFFSALFLALAPFLFFFGVKGFVLVGLPFFYVPAELQNGAAVAALAVGGWLASGLCGGYPEWRKPLGALTGLLLAAQGVLAFVV